MRMRFGGFIFYLILVSVLVCGSVLAFNYGASYSGESWDNQIGPLGEPYLETLCWDSGWNNFTNSLINDLDGNLGYNCPTNTGNAFGNHIQYLVGGIKFDTPQSFNRVIPKWSRYVSGVDRRNYPRSYELNFSVKYSDGSWEILRREKEVLPWDGIEELEGSADLCRGSIQGDELAWCLNGSWNDVVEVRFGFNSSTSFAHHVSAIEEIWLADLCVHDSECNAHAQGELWVDFSGNTYCVGQSAQGDSCSWIYTGDNSCSWTGCSYPVEKVCAACPLGCDVASGKCVSPPECSVATVAADCTDFLPGEVETDWYCSANRECQDLYGDPVCDSQGDCQYSASPRCTDCLLGCDAATGRCNSGCTDDSFCPADSVSYTCSGAIPNLVLMTQTTDNYCDVNTGQCLSDITVDEVNCGDINYGTPFCIGDSQRVRNNQIPTCNPVANGCGLTNSLDVMNICVMPQTCDPVQGCMSATPSLKWKDTNMDVISGADLGDLVYMSWGNAASQGLNDGDTVYFEIIEKDLAFNENIRVEPDWRVGRVVNGEAIGNWTISADDLLKAGNELENFKFRVVYGSERTNYGDDLKINPNSDDHPLEISILNPPCGAHYDLNHDLNVRISLDDLDSVVGGSVLINGQNTGVDLVNGINDFSYSLTEAGNVQVEVLAKTDNEVKGAISSIMVVDLTEAREYLAACIDEPTYLDNIPSGRDVLFSAMSTRGLTRLQTGGPLYEVGKEDMRFFWKFSSGNNPYNDGTNKLSHFFHKNFQSPGRNWATLDVELKDNPTHLTQI